MEGRVAAMASSGAAQAQAGGTGRRRGEQRCSQAQLQRPVARRRVARRRPATCGGGSRADQRPWRAHGALASRGRREKMAVGEQQQKKGAARRQHGTRGTRASFGGAVAKLALVTPANIGALQSYPIKEISSQDLSGEEIKENN